MKLLRLGNLFKLPAQTWVWVGFGY